MRTYSDLYTTVDITVRKSGYKLLISAIKAAKKHSGYVKDSRNRIVWIDGKLFINGKE
jgi:hypothetical protein